jgi:hypothetical protein
MQRRRQVQIVGWLLSVVLSGHHLATLPAAVPAIREAKDANLASFASAQKRLRMAFL